MFSTPFRLFHKVYPLDSRDEIETSSQWVLAASERLHRRVTQLRGRRLLNFRLSGATLRDGKLQFPFRVGGTIDSLVFSRGKGDKGVDALQEHQ
jgi:hypothetical protein